MFGALGIFTKGDYLFILQTRTILSMKVIALNYYLMWRQPPRWPGFLMFLPLCVLRGIGLPGSNKTL